MGSPWEQMPLDVAAEVIEHLKWDRGASAVFRRICKEWRDAHDQIVRMFHLSGAGMFRQMECLVCLELGQLEWCMAKCCRNTVRHTPTHQHLPCYWSHYAVTPGGTSPTHQALGKQEHLGNIQGTYRKDSGNIQRTRTPAGVKVASAARSTI
jgi:hypothetical protein